MTNRTGYPTRIVVIDTGYWFYGIPIQQNNHAWVEVNINGEWYFFDQTTYAEYHVLKIDAYKDRWFGKPENYDTFSPDQVLRVYLEETKEDMSQNYIKLMYQPKISTKYNQSNVSYNVGFNELINRLELQLH